MKKLMSKYLTLLMAIAIGICWSSCQNDSSLQSPTTAEQSKIPPPPPPPSRQAVGMDTLALDSNKVFTVVDHMPSFPEGEAALMKYLNAHINYPKAAREEGIQGTVVVQFIVGTDGKLGNVKIVSPKKGGGLEEAALSVVKNMPSWIPGKQKGKKVTVQYNLPIRFVIQ